MSDAELLGRLRAAITAGEAVDLGAGDGAGDDPLQRASWPSSRCVPAAVLVRALTEPFEAASRPRRLWPRHAVIDDQIDLDDREVSCSIVLEHCYVAQRLLLREAVVPGLRLPGCVLTNGLDA